MAKYRKRAPALFEVMGGRKSSEPSSTPSRPTLGLPSIKAPSFKAPMFKAPAWWSNWQQRRAAAREAASRVVHEPPAEVEAPMRIGPTSSGEPRKKRLSIHVDWTNAVIACSAVVIVLGVSYMLIQKLAGTPVPTMSAVATTELRKQTARPDVLELPRRAAASAGTPETVTVPPRPERAAAPVALGKRVINMNYVVIQSYPDEKLATDAAELLNKHGVSCSVVKGLARWTNPRWFSIVGYKEFGPRYAGSPELNAYLKQIDEVSKVFAGRSKWKQFTPQLYRWGADSER